MEQKNKFEICINERLCKEQLKMYCLDYGVDENGDTVFGAKSHEEINSIGHLLLLFIYMDNENAPSLLCKFYGFSTLLNDNERQLLLSLSSSYDKLQSTLEELYSKYYKELENYKKQIIDIIEYCIFNDNPDFEDLSPLQKLYIFINTHSIEDYPILKNTTFKKILKISNNVSKMDEKKLAQAIKVDKDNAYEIQEVYEFDNFYNILFFELLQILQNKIHLKKCKNCGKYFATSNSAVMYCSNNFENGRTCKEIGASKVFIKNLDNDEAYKLYRKVYKRKHALAKTKDVKFELDYFDFKHKGKNMKNSYKLGEISKEEFIEWLENV